MKYEFLTNKIYQENFGNFKKCEEKWIEKDMEFIKTLFLEKSAEEKLNDGKIINLSDGFLRTKNEKPRCELCGGNLGEYAVSRRDNKTKICSDCGLKEAFEDVRSARELESDLNEKELPQLCYHEDCLRPGDIIIIKRGVSGYYKTELKGNYMDFNESIGVDRSTAEAMKNGSMFGWDCVAAKE